MPILCSSSLGSASKYPLPFFPKNEGKASPLGKATGVGMKGRKSFPHCRIARWADFDSPAGNYSGHASIAFGSVVGLINVHTYLQPAAANMERREAGGRRGDGRSERMPSASLVFYFLVSTQPGRAYATSCQPSQRRPSLKFFAQLGAGVAYPKGEAFPSFVRKKGMSILG